MAEELSGGCLLWFSDCSQALHCLLAVVASGVELSGTVCECSCGHLKDHSCSLQKASVLRDV